MKARFAHSELIGVIAVALLIGACRTSRPIVEKPAGQLTIGVALPLSGKLKSFGEGGRSAVRLAAGELDKSADSKIRVVVRDSRGDAAGAAQAVSELIEQDGAIAIVGPLFRTEATAAAEKAQELGVPLIALTGDRQVTSAGAYAFRAGLSPEDEMEALVAYAMGELKLKTFAVLHPRSVYGELMLQQFRERVTERGGNIVGIETYAEEDTTFTEPIKRLVKRDAPASRPDFARAIAKCKDAPDSYRKGRCEREAREKLPPVIEFEALFIPDSHDRIALIAPAVVAEDIIVERDPRQLQQIEKALDRKVQPITLLGTSAWNNAELPKKAGRTVENAVFPEVFFEGAGDEPTRKFVAAFKKHIGPRPERQHALLYDAVRFLREVLSREQPKTTADLLDAMHAIGAFSGVTGEISFQESNEAKRTLKILTIKNQGIRSVRGGENPSASRQTRLPVTSASIRASDHHATR
jgi:branched-chain amino acid transport system substrate-binding protein